MADLGLLARAAMVDLDPRSLGGDAGPPPVLHWPEQSAEICGLSGLLLLMALANLVFCMRGKTAGARGGSGAQGRAEQGLAAALASADAGPPGDRAVTAAAASVEVQEKPAAGERVDTKALTGIRGLAALHVACGHYSLYSTNVDLLGGASMSFFYLLSGFVMTLGYASDLATESAPSRTLDARKFWRNRFARLYPTYLLTSVYSLVFMLILTQLSLVPEVPGFVFTVPAQLYGFALTVVGANMWLYPLNAVIQDPAWNIQLPSNGVAWTMQTMALFYLLFPLALPWLRTVQRRPMVLHMLFWWQALTFMAFYAAAYMWMPGSPMYGYWVARAWPFSRFCVFIMGCLLAVERTRGRGAGVVLNGLATERTPVFWGRTATACGAAYVVYCVLGVVAMQAVKPAGTSFEGEMGLGAFWMIRGAFEALAPFLHMVLIISLTRCGDLGPLAKLCRSAPLQTFGAISMQFYLMHSNVLFTLNAAIYGAMMHVRLWTVFAGLPISALIGWMLERYFEAPLRKRLRS